MGVGVTQRDIRTVPLLPACSESRAVQLRGPAGRQGSRAARLDRVVSGLGRRAGAGRAVRPRRRSSIDGESRRRVRSAAIDFPIAPSWLGLAVPQEPSMCRA